MKDRFLVIYRCIIVIFLSFSAHAQGLGPIEQPTDYILTSPRLGLTPTKADTLSDGSQNISSFFAWSNTSIFHNPEMNDVAGEGKRITPCLDSNKNCYSVDAETRTLLTQYQLGLADDSQLGISLPLIWRGGGVLDPAISSWHNAFGFHQGRRDLVSDDQYSVEGKTDDHTFAFDDGLGLGNLVLTYKKEIDADSDSVTSIQPEISLPTASDTFGHDGIDAGISLLHRHDLPIGIAHIGVGIFGATNRNTAGIEYQPVHAEAFAHYEYPFTQKFSGLVGLNGSTKMISNVPNHPDYATYLDVGLKFAALLNEFSFLVRENPAPRNGSTDISFIFGLTHTFR